MRKMLVIPVVHALFSLLPGCSSTSVDAVVDPATNKLASLHISSFNFITDRMLSATRGLDGTFNFGYNTNPDQAGQQGAWAAINKLADKIPAVPIAP